MGEKPKNTLLSAQLQTEMINKVLGSKAADSLLHTFSKSFSGFVVRMTELEMNAMSKMDGIVSIFPSEKRKLHTTRSWDFTGFPIGVTRATAESELIIGVLDTGIWPESASFNDSGFGPPPAKWRGSCQPASNFTCNNKIVGAKYYKAGGGFSQEDQPSPRDSDGHGTHTASTAAGGVVSGVSMLGLGGGTARGGVPGARLAIYKICWSDGCDDADILAAFDDAIADGVDIISLSVGGSTPLNYFSDSIAIGAYHSMKNGILSSISAGNDGPGYYTTTNVAPWSLGVAASTIDRKFFTNVQLGNNKIYQGVSLNTFDIGNRQYPLIYGGNAPNSTGGFDGNTSRHCSTGSLNATLVSGKIVLCDSWITGAGPFSAGAAGAMLYDGGEGDVAYSVPLPASFLNVTSLQGVYSYLTAATGPTATVFKSGQANDTLAPYVASFSSRGPSPITLDILKPDISAPGVDILAAWSGAAPFTRVEGDNRLVTYNIISGTSMACPHASAVAAYVKSFHPTWSPAAIKSAMMTTAVPMSAVSSAQAEFAYGSGHINPVEAIDPGLVYDAGPADYVNFLCTQNYTTERLRAVTGDNSTCPSVSTGSAHDLNYPSFALGTSNRTNISPTSYRRTVTNVGAPTSTYKATVTAPPGLIVQVTPDVLNFSSAGESKSYSVTVSGGFSTTVASAAVVWDDGVHRVRNIGLDLLKKKRKEEEEERRLDRNCCSRSLRICSEFEGNEKESIWKENKGKEKNGFRGAKRNRCF
uniref:Cucumisin n=1 Tax=Kalanchoe fedtschenkoi TaxID=63787 RepID=A0A7N0TQ85_KALFE